MPPARFSPSRPPQTTERSPRLQPGNGHTPFGLLRMSSFLGSLPEPAGRGSRVVLGPGAGGAGARVCGGWGTSMSPDVYNGNAHNRKASV